MDRWQGKIAVITGASSGIGLATAKAFVKAGLIVVGLARRKEKMASEMMDASGPGKFYPKYCDVSKESDVVEALEYVDSTFKGLHVLVNNAGISVAKTIESAEMKELELVIKTNLMGCLYCSKHAIALMKKYNEEGHIITMNSVAGHRVPNQNWFGGFGEKTISFDIYPATKFAIRALSEIFTNELLGGKIRVTNVSPGLVLTELAYNFGIEEAAKLGFVFPALKAEDVADALCYIIGTPPHVQITEMIIKPTGEPY